MIELDGNAIGGELYEVFDVDLTGVMGVCTYCGARAPVAESIVYMRGPGTIARCRACHELHIVLVTIRDVTCVDIRGLAELEMP